MVSNLFVDKYRNNWEDIDVPIGLECGFGAFLVHFF